MNKRFSSKAFPLLAQIVDDIEATLQCSKFQAYTNVIDIDAWENIKFNMERNRKLAESGFGFCITNYQEYGDFKRLIVINMKNCNRASFTERETAAIIFHELGHLLNVLEPIQEPTFLYCDANGSAYSQTLYDEIKAKNTMNMELYADSYANLHGYGVELISTFDKQNELFDQKIGYFDERVQNIVHKEVLEGTVMPIRKNGW